MRGTVSHPHQPSNASRDRCVNFDETASSQAGQDNNSRCPVSLDLVQLHVANLRRARSAETFVSSLSHSIWSAMAILSAVSPSSWPAVAVLSVLSHSIWPIPSRC